MAKVPDVATTPATPTERERGRPWPLAEASAFTGLSEDSLRRLIAAGVLVKLKLPSLRRVLVTDESLRRLAEGN
jgi:hypothetical protein